MDLKRLKKIAWRVGVCGGIATFALMNSVPFILSARVRETEQYKQALKLFYEHSEAVKCLGEPIKVKRVGTVIEDNYGTDQEKVWIRVPLEGSKDRGLLYYDYYIKDNIDGKVKLSSVNLHLEKVKDYKLLIKRPD